MIIDNQCIKFSFSELMNLCENSIGKLEALYSVGNCDFSSEVGNLMIGLCSKQSNVRDIHASGDIKCVFCPKIHYGYCRWMLRFQCVVNVSWSTSHFCPTSYIGL